MTYKSIALALALAGCALAQDPAALGRSAATKRNLIPGARVTPDQKRVLEAYGPEVLVKFNSQDVPVYLMGQLSARTRPDDAIAEARSALNLHGAAFRRGPNDEFTFAGIQTDKNGLLNVRMTQSWKTIPVAGGELTIHLDRDDVKGISGHFVPDLDSQEELAGATGSVTAALPVALYGSLRDSKVVETRAPVIFVDKEGSAHLAIPVQVADSEGGDGRTDLYVDAGTGSVLGREAVVSAVAKALPVPNRLLNPGFESGKVNWTGQTFYPGFATAPSYYKLEPPTCSGATITGARTGNNWACLSGNGVSNTEVLAQKFMVPSDAVSGNLSFWLHIARVIGFTKTAVSAPTGSCASARHLRSRRSLDSRTGRSERRTAVCSSR